MNMQVAGEDLVVDPGSTIKLPEETQAKEAEQKLVKKLMDEYDQARKFDKAARKQYAIDRSYAAGTADMSWAVSTNLIGSYIDILCSYLYARNPDVRCRKAERVDHVPDPDMEQFAKTVELVVSRLWKQGRLKSAARKSVRSALSVGPGWLKVVMITDKREDPQVKAALNDARDNLASIQAAQRELAEGEVDDKQAAMAELELKIQGLEANVEVVVRKGLAIDFCSAEDVQVWLDVRFLTDYLDAGAMSNDLYVPKSQLREMFPRLTEEEAKSACTYFQRQPKDDSARAPADTLSDRDAQQFGKEGVADGNSVEFVKIIEVWDKRDNLIKTMIDGVKCWAKEPYPPPQPSTRFYPYFMLAFYEVDGSRHPQSLPWRLHKLQDDYSGTKSSFKKTRSRSIPGTLFNESQIDKDNATKIANSTEQELIGVKPTNPNVPLDSLFASKPVAAIDPLLYDTSSTQHDMEKISGVQEAQQGSVTQAKTATEAEIQQGGFAARTSSDRDAVEMMLDDLAQYTAEVSLSALTIQDVQRIAGPKAFWPQGMDINDLLTLVEVDIEAGSTGKPNTTAEREAWSVAMPLITAAMEKIQQARAMGNEPLASAYIAILRETLARMGDRIDVEAFIPQLPSTVTAPTVPGAAPVPALPGMPELPAAVPGVPTNPAVAPANAQPDLIVT